MRAAAARPSLRLALAAAVCLGTWGCRSRPGTEANRPSEDPFDAPEAAAEGPLPPSREPIVFPRSGRGVGAAEDDLRETRRVSEADPGWEEKLALASRYAQGGFDAEALEVIEAALAAEAPEPWAGRLRALKQSIHLREAEEVLRVDARGVRDYVSFGTDVDWVVRLRNVSTEEIRIAAPGGALAPDGTPLSPAALALVVVRRDVDIYTSELRRSWTQPVPLQPPAGGEIRIPPGGRHEVRARIPGADLGGPLSGLRVIEVEGTLRPSGLTVGGRAVGEPLRIRKGRVVALPENFEPLAADPLGSMERAVAAVAPVHLVVAAEFVPADGRLRAVEVLATALGEGDPALRTAALSSLAMLRERSVGQPLAPLAAPLVGALARHGERADALIDGLRVLSGRALAPDPRLWNEWWRRERAAGSTVVAPEASR